MSTNKPTLLKDIIGGGSTLADIIQRANELNDLTRLVSELLPDPTRTHVVSVNQRDDALVVIADSAVWAARIRYGAHELVEQLATQHVHVKKITVKVRPRTNARG